jgi:hypothetical protein
MLKFMAQKIVLRDVYSNSVMNGVAEAIEIIAAMKVSKRVTSFCPTTLAALGNNTDEYAEAFNLRIVEVPGKNNGYNKY